MTLSLYLSNSPHQILYSHFAWLCEFDYDAVYKIVKRRVIKSHTHSQSVWNWYICAHCFWISNLVEGYVVQTHLRWLLFLPVNWEGNTDRQKRYHLRCLQFNIVWKEVTMSCVQHVTYFLNAFNFMVKSFYVIFSLFLIGFVRNPQIIDNNSPWYLASIRSNNSLVVY